MYAYAYIPKLHQDEIFWKLIKYSDISDFQENDSKGKHYHMDIWKSHPLR